MNSDKTNKSVQKTTSSYSPAVRIVCWTMAILLAVSLLATSIVYFAV